MSKDKPQPMKWDGNTVLKFLDIYEKYDILWNTADKNIYSKRAERDVAFKRLVRELYKNGFKIPNEKSLKKKIKNLKDTYKLELNKINESRIIGDEESGVHKPKLVWFKRAHAFMGNPAGKESASSNVSKTATSLMKSISLTSFSGVTLHFPGVLREQPRHFNFFR